MSKENMTEEEIAEEAKTAAEAATAAKAAEEAAALEAKDGKGKKATGKEVIDPLTLGRTFKKEGDFAVEASFDVTLTPVFKNLNNQYLASQTKAKEDNDKLLTEIEGLTGKLSDKKDVSDDERKTITAQIEEMKGQIVISNKTAEAATTELLKVQTAASLGLPYNFVEYVQGETPEAIRASVEKVLEDFKVSTAKYSQDDLKAAVEAAAEKSKLETEEALKTIGKPTEAGGKVDHVYTRTEIAAMSLADYKTNQTVIQQQLADGQIK